MTRAFTTEYYPDMQNNDYGKKVVTLSCRVNNGKRFKALTNKEKKDLVRVIETFLLSLNAFKSELAQ